MKQPFPKIILCCLILFLNTSAAITYNLANETLLMMPIRLGTALIHGAGISLIITLSIHYIHRLLNINLTSFFLFILWLIFVAESFLLFNFYSLITPSIINVIMETNASEASEFFTSYFGTGALTLLFLLLLASFLIFHFRTRISNIPVPGFLHKKKFLLPICCFILISYIGLDYYVTQVRHMTSYQMLTGIERIYHSTQNTLRDRQEYQKHIELARQTAPCLTQNTSSIPYVVVILGESQSKWHMNAYDYPLQTTPYLNKRIKNKETYLFDRVQTPRTVTSEAIRQIMTFYTDQSTQPWYEYHTLPAIMKEAGYYTCWLSNQDSFAVGDNNSTAGIASTSSVVEFAHLRHASEERYGYFDGDLLPLLKKHISQPNSKKFIILHLMGSHRRYTNRYPSEFNRFGIDDIKKKTNSENKRTISEYDNSILYNDHICEEIIKLLESKEAVIFSFPDHGEEVYDTRNMCGHGKDNPSAPMKEIPFWIWTSNSFRNKYPSEAEMIRKNTSKPFNTTDVIHTIMHLCGIQSKDYKEDNSLFHNEGIPQTSTRL